ncbi:MAG: transketolase [Spirochaetaceae bacterium]|jgi:transketolase|nr:transketolase [Spirochaetaceae bacterium]
MSDEDLKELLEQAKEIRIKTIDSIGFLGVGHIGGAMSIVELLTILYYRKMKIDPENPKMEDRDKLVLSKGHAGPALYSILAQKGFFPEELLHTLNKGGTTLPSHCDMNKTPGIDMTTGSLGQGLSSSIGLALAMRLDNIDRNVFTIIGDGESQEGQNWEAAMAASQFKLNKLIAFTDNNKMQIDGYTDDIMPIGDLESKWSSFGWNTARIDGHDFAALDKAIDNARLSTEKPTMIILDTIKGKGCTFAEGVITNHNMPFTYDQAKEAIKALG